MKDETVSLEVAIEMVLSNGPTFETIAGLCNMAVEADRLAQRTWVSLTPQERDEINEQVYGAVPHHVAFYHAIEARLKKKNNG